MDLAGSENNEVSERQPIFAILWKEKKGLTYLLVTIPLAWPNLHQPRGFGGIIDLKPGSWLKTP